MTIFEAKLAGTQNKKTGQPLCIATVHRVPGNDYITVNFSEPDLPLFFVPTSVRGFPTSAVVYKGVQNA